jgi:hypothetical protein
MARIANPVQIRRTDANEEVDEDVIRLSYLMALAQHLRDPPGSTATASRASSRSSSSSVTRAAWVQGTPCREWDAVEVKLDQGLRAAIAYLYQRNAEIGAEDPPFTAHTARCEHKRGE